MSLVTASSRFLFSILFFAILCLFPRPASCIKPPATLDDLKKLNILCYVPSFLPKGFKLKSVSISYDEPSPDEESAGRFPLYNLEYGDNSGGSFTVDSAREGIGDRNLLETEDSEETTITSPFGPMYLIYTPKTAPSGSGRLDDIKGHPQGERRGETKFVKGQGTRSRKVEIRANWAEDPNMQREKAKDQMAHPVLGRYHGFSATEITVAEFRKIISSLHPIRP